jgi:hypothetical protein
MMRFLWNLTAFAPVVGVGAALTMANFERRGGIGVGGAWSMTTHFTYGWPAMALNRSVSESVDFATGQVTIWRVDCSWSGTGILIDIAASLLVLASTIIACERWRRTTRHWQFSVRSLLTTTTITALLLVLYQNEFWFYIRFFPSHIFHGGLRLSPLHIVIPVAFGLGCLIYSVGCIAMQCGAVAWGLGRGAVGALRSNRFRV